MTRGRENGSDFTKLAKSDITYLYICRITHTCGVVSICDNIELKTKKRKKKKKSAHIHSLVSLTLKYDNSP
jgi:hypothetical protein